MACICRTGAVEVSRPPAAVREPRSIALSVPRSRVCAEVRSGEHHIADLLAGRSPPPAIQSPTPPMRIRRHLRDSCRDGSAPILATMAGGSGMAARADLLIRNSARPDNGAPTRLLAMSLAERGRMPYV